MLSFRSVSHLILLTAPMWLTAGCDRFKDTGDTTETGDTNYPGARSNMPDQGWRINVQPVDWRDTHNRASQSPDGTKKNQR